jgi:hypothetical protein
MKNLTAEIEFLFGTGANFTYTEEEKEYLLRIIQSKFYKNISRLLICVENSVKVGMGAQRLGREIRKYFNVDKELNPEYLKHLEDTWNKYKNYHLVNPLKENPFKQKLDKEIDNIKHYASQLKKGDLGYQGALRTWVSKFSKNIDDFSHDYFADIAAKKMKNRALMTARTESARAYTDAYIDSVKDLPIVIGFEIHLSGIHSGHCICESYIGKVFSKEEIESNKPPYHPNCGCFIIEKVERDLNKLAKRLVVNV